MSDTMITCPSCSQELEVPQELLGQVVECPACEQSIQLPAPANTPRKKIVVKKRRPAPSSRPTTRRPAAQPQSSSQISAPQGCAIIVVAAFVIIIFGYISSGGCGSGSRPSTSPSPSYTMPSPKPKAWYSGGTLHSATMAEWHSATYKNRLATSADFVCKMYQMEGKTIPPVNDIKPLAATLEREISASYVPEAGTMEVTEVVAVLLVYMAQSL